MAEADSLRMVAEVVDKFSGPLKQLQNMLRGMSAGPQTKQLSSDFDTVHKAASRAGAEIKGVLTPALAAIGFTSLTVGGALAGIGAALRGFAGNTAQLSLLSREVGLSAQKLREFGALGSHFGLDTGTMQGAARSFAQNMRDMRTGASDTLAWLAAQGKTAEQRGKFQAFALDLRATKSNEEALAKTLDFLAQIPDAVERGMLSQRLLGSSALGIIGSENWRKVVDDIRKSIGTLGGDAAKNALAFQRSMDAISLSLMGIRDAVGADVMTKLTPLMTGLREWADLNREKIATGIVDSITSLARTMQETDWSAIGGGAMKFLREIAQLAENAGKAISGISKAIEAFKKGNIIEGIKRLDQSTRVFDTPSDEAPKEAPSRSSALFDELREQLAQLKQQREELAGRVQKAEPGSPLAERGPDLLERQDRSIKNIEEAIRKAGAMVMSEWMRDVARSVGDMKDKAAEGAEKGIVKGLQGLLDRTSLDTSPAGLGGAQIQRASYNPGRGLPESLGRLARPPMGYDAPERREAPVRPRSEPEARLPRDEDARSVGGRFNGIPRAALSPREIQQAPGVPETRRSLEGLENGGGYGSVDKRQVETYIRESAKRHGIDPETAMRVARSEGMNQYTGDKGTSFGPFQLHVGGGLGDKFRKEHPDLDLKDPSTYRQQTDFAMREAAKGGWGPWHGAARVGIAPRQGIGTSDRSAWGKESYPPLAEGGGSPSGVTDISRLANYNRGKVGKVDGFVFHHTGGRGTPEGVVNTLNQRGLGVQYVMGRDGKVYQTLPDGARGAHMQDGSGKGTGLSNANTMGMEVIAKDDRDVTRAQIESARQFMKSFRERHGNVPVFGHGEVNPGHKQATEGMTITDTLRRDQQRQYGLRGMWPEGWKERDVAPSKTSAPDLEGGISRGFDSWRRNTDVLREMSDTPGGGLLERARESGVVGSPSVEAKGSVNINLEGFPKGVRTKTSSEGLFKEVNLNRGAAMPMSEDA